MNEQKILIFQYLHYQLLKWYKENNSNLSINDNDLSILKSMKLLFFTVSVNCKDSNSLLDSPFNNFVAMPYGHVELSIYNEVNNPFSNLSLSIGKRKTEFIDENMNFSSIDSTMKQRVDDSINRLKLLNKNIINYSAFELVELSHKWDSWKKYFNEANSNGSRIKRIPPEAIKNEDKFYIL